MDIDPLAPALRECDESYMVPPLDDEGYVPTLTDLCRAADIALLFPLIDPEVPVLAAARDELEGSGVRAMVIADEAARITADKLATAELFERLDVPGPAWWTAAEAGTRDLDFPLFLKPRFGSAGVGSRVVADRRELEFWLGAESDAIVQELLPGPEITTDVLCLQDGRADAIVSRERLEVRGGEVSKGRTTHDPRVVDHCARIAEALNARGPITVQCLLKDGEPRFTEVNARFGGGVPLAFAAGMRAPHWLLAHAAGTDPELPALGSYEIELYMTRFDDSSYVREEERAALAGRRL